MRKATLTIFGMIILLLSGCILGQDLKNYFETNMTKETENHSSKFSEVNIITLFDNYEYNPALKTGWGFSCLIKINTDLHKLENKPTQILFDTGADSETLLFNMEKLDINPMNINTVILSHIHQDHVGGLDGFLERNGNVKVYIPSSFPNSMREKIKSYGGEYINISNSTKILEEVYSTGELGIWIKEQSLIISTNKGLVVITGCAHPGIVNIIKRAKEIFPKEQVYLVMGGFHLSGTSDFELKSIIKDFKKLEVQKAAPCHCSGDETRQLFKEEYQDNFIENGVGKIINIK